jgi:hypothetical protein
VRHLATFALGLAAGVLLALLLTTNATSRQPSAPRPAPSEFRRLVSTERTEVPTLRPSATPTTSSGAAPANAATDPVPTVAPATPKPTRKPRGTSARLVGTATWYAYRRGHAAAGPRLREEMGAGWRGETVYVNGTPVVLSDFMGTRNRDKVIDLDDGLFRAICGDLSMGVCEVEVRW